MSEITKIYNKIQEANALLIDANRCLLEATEITKKIQSNQSKAANELMSVLFDDKGNFKGRNMSGMSATTTRVLNELNSKAYPVTAGTLARVTGFTIKTIHTTIWDLRRRGFNIEKTSGKSKQRYKLAVKGA